MSGLTPEGKPLPIWHVIEEVRKRDGKRETITRMIQNEEASNTLLGYPEYNGMKVVTICVAGPLRLGKSFLLNCFLRHLEGRRTSSSDQALEGFDWGKSANPVTKGIQLWSKPLVMKLTGGEKVVVLLMDTEGAFDMESSFAEGAKLAALSAYLSSMLIFNLRSRFQKNYFDYLRYFTEYSKTATQLGAEENVLCQQLTFLIRDWCNTDEYEFGWDGGDEYLNHTMQESPKDHHELNETKRHLRTSFSNLNCYLMPQPEKSVIEDSNFSGQWSQMDERFKTFLQKFINVYLSPESLQVKRINGREIRWEHLPALFKGTTEAFNQDDLPEPKSLIAMNEQLKAKMVIDACKQIYENHMRSLDYSKQTDLQYSYFENEHNSAINQALRYLHECLPPEGIDGWEHELNGIIQEIKTPYHEIFLTNLGTLVVTACMETFTKHMNQINYDNIDSLDFNDFLEAKERAKSVAMQELDAKIPADHRERWKATLEQQILIVNETCLVRFMEVLKAKKNKTKADEEKYDAMRLEHDLTLRLLEENSRRLHEQQMQSEKNFERMLEVFNKTQQDMNMKMLEMQKHTMEMMEANKSGCVMM